MAGGRLPAKRAAPTPVWAAAASASHVCAARANGTLDLFSLPSGARAAPPPALPSPRGRPTALALRADGAAPPAALAGTEAGDVLLGGRVVATLAGAPVAAAVFAGSVALAVGGTARELLVLSAGDARVLHRHALSAEHRAPLVALAADVRGSRAAVCSQAVTLVDVASGAVLRRYSGHASPVSAACMLPGGRRFITACRGDRFVCMWDAELDGDKSKGAGASAVKRRRKMAAVSPCHTFVAPGSGVCTLTVDALETSGVSIAAVLKSGAVAVWRNWTEKGATSPSQCSFVIKPALPGSAQPVPQVFIAAFSEVGTLTVLYGSALKPTAHRVVLHEVEGLDVVLPRCEADLLVSKSARKDDNNSKAALAKDAMAVARSSVSAMPDTSKGKRKHNGILMANGDADEEGEGSSEDDDEEGESEEEDDEPSIQEKLMALGVSQDVSNIPGADDLPTPSKNKNILGSRVNVILQAVRSRDLDLFDKSIDVKGKMLIRSTVERLPPDVATGAMLDMLVDRLQRFPKRAEFLVQWIREVLLEHAGSLISQQRSNALLALVSIVSERTQALEGLSRLEGRLELVVGQAARLKRAGERTKTANAVPVAEYEEEEGSESDEEEEDGSSDEVSAGSGSEVDSEDGEDETHDFSNTDESSGSGESESDEEMEDVSNRAAGETDKGASDAGEGVKMNGSRVADDGESSEEEDSSDEGD